jgi:alcohol dehydrogenase class IV
MSRLHLEQRLSDIGAHSPSALKDVAESVNIERLSNNPVTFEKSRLSLLLETCW